MESNAKALGLSVVRTFVPVLVGLVVTGLTSAGAEDDGSLNENVAALVTLGVTTVYYGVVRLLEQHASKYFGWLLGAPKAPEYPTSPNP